MTRSRGQSLVEMSVVLPIFILGMIGVLEFGRMLYQWQALYRAARAGAVHAAMAPRNTNEITKLGTSTAVQAMAPYPFKYSAPQVDFSLEQLATEPIVVTLSCPFVTPLANWVPGLENFQLTASAAAFFATIGPPKSTEPTGPPQDPVPDSDTGGSTGGGDGGSTGGSGGSGTTDGGSDSGSGDDSSQNTIRTVVPE